MTRKQRRMLAIGVGGAFLAGAATLASFAFRDAIVFFVPPSELIADAPAPDQRLRLGGMVAEGSLLRGQGKAVTFEITDYAETVPVSFAGVLPDLFREGQGAVCEGYYRDGVFQADEVLAKHDEKYMPPDIADTLKEPRPGV